MNRAKIDNYLDQTENRFELILTVADKVHETLLLSENNREKSNKKVTIEALESLAHENKKFPFLKN